MGGEIAELFYDAKRSKWRFFWGDETFYNEQNQLVEFKTSLEALEWIKSEHPNLAVRVGEEQMTLGLSGEDNDK